MLSCPEDPYFCMPIFHFSLIPTTECHDKEAITLSARILELVLFLYPGKIDFFYGVSASVEVENWLVKRKHTPPHFLHSYLVRQTCKCDFTHLTNKRI